MTFFCCHVCSGSDLFIMTMILGIVFLFRDVQGKLYVGGDYFPIFLKAREGLPELKRFVSLHMGSEYVGRAYTISVPVPLLCEKEFIIEVDDEVTLTYILGFARRGELEVIKFYVVLRPNRNVALRAVEENILSFHNEREDAMSMSSVVSTVPSMDGAWCRRAPEKPIISLGDL